MNQEAYTFPSVSSNPSPSSSDNSFDMNIEITPIVLLYVTLISIIFFVFALLHLLVLFLFRPRTRDAYDEESAIAFEGQLHTPFSLHDSGGDQSLIDALPVFHYKTIIGLGHEPFDCAVCLYEFKPEDKLRLLPKCSHAFHVDCIDTWLLSNSTCPLCRDNILHGLTALSSPVSLVLESDGESSQSSDSLLEPTYFDDVESKSGDISGQNDESRPENDERLLLLS